MAQIMQKSRPGWLVIALASIVSLSACVNEGAEIFNRIPASAGASEAEWPKLADIPPTPPQGVYTSEIPDPATGDAIRVEMAVAAAELEQRREAVSGPVE